MANCNSGFGKRGEPILTNQIGGKFYCEKKECLLKQLPYFWKGRLFVEISEFEVITSACGTFKAGTRF